MRFLHFQGLLLLVLACAALFGPLPAAHACTAQGCVLAGPRLASVDTARGELTNALLGGLTNSSITVTAADWDTLATGEVNVLGLQNAVSAAVGPSNPASLSTIFNAAASATVGTNQAGVSAALGRVANAFTVPVGNVYLSELIQVTGAPGNTRINALDLVTGVVQLFNFRNVVDTPAPITVDLSKVTGLGLGSLSIAARVIEPPVFICGPTGTAFHTAAIRLKLNLGLSTISVSATALNGGITSGAMITLTSASLYVEVARANGNITGVLDGANNKFSGNATPGVVDLYLGQITDAVFFDRMKMLSASDFTAANIGTLKVSVLGVPATVAIEVKTFAHGDSPSATRLDFDGPYPETLTAYTHASFVANLLSSLTSNFTLTLNPTGVLGSALSFLLNGTKTIIVNVLSPVLATVLDQVVDPVLELIGVRLGEVDVTAAAPGVYQLCSVAGVTYNDANHSARQELAESGSGLTLYAKLIATSAPTVVSQVATVNTSTGSFSFSNVLPATYNVIIDTNTTTSDVTAGVTAGWIGTEVPSLSRSFTLAALDITGQSFGIYNGSKLSGSVFKDTGVGNGVANNVLRDGTETSLAGVTIKVTDAAGTTAYDTTTSMDSGAYTLWIPAAAGATSLKITELNLSTAQVSTGANVGTTAGTYDRASDTVTFTHVVGTVYSGVNFADVPANQFDTDGRQNILPGTVAFYSHAFIAGTAGTVTFSTSAPVTPGWSNLLFRDTNCNAAVDHGETQLTSLAVVADQKVCAVIKVFAADTAAFDEHYPVTVAAAFVYANSALTDSLSRNDLTLCGTASNTGLHLMKVVDRSMAKPGDVLTYTITYSNRSTAPLTTLKIYDATPGYTVFTDGGCGTPPSGITGCTLTAQPAAGAAGAIQWTLDGSLAAGASGTVTFRVVLQ